MISTIKSSGPFGDPSDQRSRPERDGQDGHPPQRHPAAPPRDVRLLIEPDAKGVLTYRLVDRATGAVISVVSREDLLKMVADPNYTAGKVISTTA